jgi:hypothetical protein
MVSGMVGRNERQAAVAAKIPPMVQAPSQKTRNALPLPELIFASAEVNPTVQPPSQHSRNKPAK